MFGLTLDQLVASGILAAFIGGIFAGIHILLNKKVRAPTDDEAARRAAIVERNEIVATYKADLDGAKKDIKDMKLEMVALNHVVESQGDEINELESQALAYEHYIYRCIGTIYKLGGEIPKPPPTKIKTEEGDKQNG